MWVIFRKTPSRVAAEMWKEFLEAEGVPARVLMEEGKESLAETAPHVVYVAKGKMHVVEEMLRNV